MNILFVCSGNTCRSPMAEGYFNSKHIKKVSATSAGFIRDGDKVSQNAVSVMKEIGIDISLHTSKIISAGDTTLADRIFCMGEAHKSALINAGVPSDKVSVLSGGIPDPYGGNTETYRSCRDKIIKAVDSLVYDGEILPYKVLSAVESDAKNIEELEKECFSLPWSIDGIIQSMRHNTVFFKAVSGEKTVGYISVTAVAGEGYINNIAVSCNYRGKGIGSMLLDRAITFSRSKKLEFLSLEVRKSNSPAISLYKKAGFNEEGIRKNFYDNPKEDAIIMTRRFKSC